MQVAEERKTRRALLLIAGTLSFVASIAFLILLLRYVFDGAGLQLFPLHLSSESVLLGLVHVVGFASGAMIGFCLGAYLCSKALA